MQFVFKFCHLSQHCPLELTFPTSPTSIQDCIFHVGVMSLDDFKNINQILLFPNFKLPAALVLSVTATQAALFFLKHKGGPFPPGAPQLFPQLTPPHLFISPQELPGHSVYRHILGFPLSQFTLDYLPVT